MEPEPYVRDPNNIPIRSPTPPLDSSIEDLDELCMDQELENLDDIACTTRKPHFLDYDSIPPPGFEDDDCSSTIAVKGVPRATVYSGENVKLDKKYETDGEISDFELAASNVMKTHRKEKTAAAATDVESALNKGESSSSMYPSSSAKNTGARRKKHFLDENPIPPDYEIDRDREHRSLDRNFERTKDYDIKYERKHSLDRERPKKVKETSFALARFLEHDTSASVYHGTWPADRPNDTKYSANLTSSLQPGELKHLGPKVECVYSLLSMLGCKDQLEISSKFLELSKTPETCAALRHSRCIPLIVQMIHSDADDQTRKRASTALHNVVNCHPDDKAGRREAKVLRHIEQIMDYCDMLKNLLTKGETVADDSSDQHPLQAMCSLMKISFDEEHRHAMCQLGALQAIASMVHYDHAVHGHNSSDDRCVVLRRYAGMALTNLTFGDGNNKALLCTNKDFMKALVAQLNSNADDLLQVTASVIRNLSWRADNTMKTVLNEIGTVTALSRAVMRNKNENTIKALLSALWNLSAHCSTNKAEFCAVDGALAFLVDMLVYEGPSKTLTIIENAGGILRNVSSHIAVKESYRKILRQRNCLGILLQQLSSESLTIVSNACGTLWNLSARCPEDQKFLLDNKAVSMLSLLIHSKHKMISNGSSAALKNLQNFRPSGLNHNSLDPIAKSMRLKELPSLNVRKQRAFEQELDQNLSETCENIEVTTPPKEHKSIDDFISLSQYPGASTCSGVSSIGLLTKSAVVTKSDSKDSIVSITKSDSGFDKLPRTEEFKSHVRTSTPNQIDGNAMTEKTNTKDDEQNLPQNNSQSKGPTPAPRRSLKKTDENAFNEHAGASTGDGGTYQETDIDQITDFSLRYGEYQNEESDSDEVKQTATDAYGNEILLVLEDTVKCYQTEGTPYVISNAASVSDLRGMTKTTSEQRTENNKNKVVKSGHVTIESSGINTPEKTTNYCEEGTPGYSLYGSYSSLEETGDGVVAASGCSNPHEEDNLNDTIKEINELDVVEEKVEGEHDQTCGTETNPTTPGGTHLNPVTFETPMMFSRHSSMGSLSSAEPAMMDDRSSVVSDFSRMASGIISPSEIPDSPSQMVPQSPRRVSSGGGGHVIAFPTTPPMLHCGSVGMSGRLRSVFEDDVNTFGVENTPALFSCATSLSNLSLDDEPKIATDSLTKEMRLTHPSEDHEDAIDVPLQEQIFINDTAPQTAVTSDSDEADDDNGVLAACINIGMNSGVKEQKPTAVSPSLSISNRLVTGGENSNDSSDSSSSDIGSDSILEQCIRDGIQKSTTSKPKPKLSQMPGPKIVQNNPMELQRQHQPTSMSPTYLNRPVLDGISNSNMHSLHYQPTTTTAVDDSLSSISIDSEEDGKILSQAIAAGSQVKTKQNHITQPTIQPSTSSAFALKSTTNAPIFTQSHQFQMAKPFHNVGDPNDSFSSLESMESNDPNHAAILAQCIQSGMNKQIKEKPSTKPRTVPALPVASSIPKPNASPKRSQLPTFKSPSQFERERQKERERKDELLLQECIQTGISKVGSGVPRTIDAHIKPPVRHVRQVLAPTDYTQRLANMNLGEFQQQQQNVANSKNEETTSVAVSDIVSAPYTAQGVVEMKSQHQQEGTNALKKDRYHHHITNQMIKTGSNQITNGLNAKDLQMSYGSLNLSSESNILNCSNEYPADMKLGDDCTDVASSAQDEHDESSMEMEMSNEFLMEQIDESCLSFNQKVDKHKDPDLMLKSVDRLTQELMSTAEFLRTTTSTTDNDGTTAFEKKSSSNSNNTWNDDTCPNDASFPSISMTAPMIASMNDDDTTISDVYNAGKFDYLSQSEIFEEPTPTNETRTFLINGENEIYEPQSYEWQQSQPESLDTTDTNRTIVNSESANNGQINFRVGGEVAGPTFRDNLPNYLSSDHYSLDTSSTMTNSTIIALEANKLATELLNMQTMADSSTSLDLDHIRPPSGMDSVSGYYDVTFSPQLSRTRKKSLPLGLMARRALNHAAPSGSLESVNSSCNLDNIKPPSLMDELLDSMISVASITSEVVENNSSNCEYSRYETAHSDIDDTPTLRSCMDLSLDGATPIPSDFSSAESTPKKVRSIKRNMTPKQKRQMAKERYRTYTIAADMVINDTIDELRNEMTASCSNSQYGNEINEDDIISEDMINIEIRDYDNNRKPTPRQRRNDDRARFQTQILDGTKLQLSNGDEQFQNVLNHQNGLNSDKDIEFNEADDTNSLEDDGDMSSIRALTNRFKFIRDAYVAQQQQTTTITPIVPNKEADANSIDFEQNSETESCYQNHCIDEETYTVSPRPKPKIVKPILRTSLGDDTNNSADEQNVSGPPESKIVRGKKKAPYVSPYRKTTTTTTTTTGLKTPISAKSSLPSVATSNDNKKKTTTIAKLTPRNQTIIAKTHVFINKSNMTNKITNVKSSLARPASASATAINANRITTNKLNKPKSAPITQTTTVPASPKLLERQGTFVKDEPTNGDVPIVTTSEPSSPAKSRIPSKLTTTTIAIITPTNKTNSFISKLKNPLQRSASIGSTKVSSKIQPSPRTTTTPKTTSVTNDAQKRRTTNTFYRSPSTPTVPQRSNSNASIKSTTSSKRESFSTQPPSRSNSNLSTTTPTAIPTKKDITSRIAGLWKKTDTGKTSTTKSTTPTAATAGKPPSGNNRLIRSSTFDNTPPGQNSTAKLVEQLGTKKPATTNNNINNNNASVTNGVVRRIKNVAGKTPAVIDDTKRISRLGTFINVEKTAAN